MEALAQGLNGAGASLEGGAAAGGHHVNQQDDPVCVLAAGQEALDAQHLQRQGSVASASATGLCGTQAAAVGWPGSPGSSSSSARQCRPCSSAWRAQLRMAAWRTRVQGTGGRCETLSSKPFRSVRELLLHRCTSGTCSKSTGCAGARPLWHPLWHRKMLPQFLDATLSWCPTDNSHGKTCEHSPCQHAAISR